MTHPALTHAAALAAEAVRDHARERAELDEVQRQLQAEIERLRAALQDILNHSDYRTGAYLDQVCDMRQIARAALKGGEASE